MLKHGLTDFQLPRKQKETFRQITIESDESESETTKGKKEASNSFFTGAVSEKETQLFEFENNKQMDPKERVKTELNMLKNLKDNMYGNEFKIKKNMSCQQENKATSCREITGMIKRPNIDTVSVKNEFVQNHEISEIPLLKSRNILVERAGTYQGHSISSLFSKQISTKMPRNFGVLEKKDSVLN